MRTVAELLAEATRRLEPVTETPRLDAEILLSHALGLTRSKLLARLSEPVDCAAFEPLLRRRIAHEPIAYIVGHWEFFSLDFLARPPVFVPRPETEHLVEVVIEFINERALRVLEVGTGAGCVAVTIGRNAPECTVVATDILPEAVALARENAERLGVKNIEFYQGDLFEALPPSTEPFDVICWNPPYVEDDAWLALSPVIRLYEHPRALLGGPDGLDEVRRIIAESASRLNPGGMLALELGMGQYDAVEKLLKTTGFVEVSFRKDLADIERIAFGIKSS